MSEHPLIKQVFNFSRLFIVRLPFIFIIQRFFIFMIFFVIFSSINFRSIPSSLVTTFITFKDKILGFITLLLKFLCESNNLFVDFVGTLSCITVSLLYCMVIRFNKIAIGFASTIKPSIKYANISNIYIDNIISSNSLVIDNNLVST